MTETETAPKPARRRFVPVPIETTFERYRKTIPAAEPTPSPSPSPRSSSPPPETATLPERKKGRFAPQLIESSRRSRRNGDVGPATKPTDKTDITPDTNHIYAPQKKKKHRKVQSLARRESCDDETAGQIFEMLAREAEKRLLEDAALAAFPNSGARAGGAEHFAIRESSDDDSSGDQSRVGTSHGPETDGEDGDALVRRTKTRTQRRSRRDSFNEDVGWALREMQEHHDQLDKARAAEGTAGMTDGAVVAPTTTIDGVLPKHDNERISTLELDQMSLEGPPADALWTTKGRESTQGSFKPIGESFMPYIPEEPKIPSYARRLREAEGDDEEEDEEEIMRQNEESVPKPIGEYAMPYIPSGPSGKPASNNANAIEEVGFRGRNPFAGYRNRDLFAERDVNRLRKKSPPMLGKDLVFPKCQSPKQTMLEPEYLWSIKKKNESHRDATGKKGLWNGYCYCEDQNEALAPFERPAMLLTPFPPSTPANPFDQAFGNDPSYFVGPEPMHLHVDHFVDYDIEHEEEERERLRMVRSAQQDVVQPEPTTTNHVQFMEAVNDSLNNSNDNTSELPPSGPLSEGGGSMALKLEERTKKSKKLGLQVLSADEKLREDKATAELEAKIAAEFTDGFVTQVYNYLSLGYPAMARAYDEELSKISQVAVCDLERDDGDVLDDLSLATGHISLDEEDVESGHPTSKNHDECPRWRALKMYIYEWARQHPDLDSISPLPGACKSDEAVGVSRLRGF